MEIRNKKGSENMVSDHLSRLETLETVQKHHLQIDDTFLDEHILSLSHDETPPWFANIASLPVLLHLTSLINKRRDSLQK